MRDFYDDGFNDGYGKSWYGDREYPQSESDRASYKRGFEYGQLRRKIGNELEEETE